MAGNSGCAAPVDEGDAEMLIAALQIAAAMQNAKITATSLSSLVLRNALCAPVSACGTPPSAGWFSEFRFKVMALCDLAIAAGDVLYFSAARPKNFFVDWPVKFYLDYEINRLAAFVSAGE